jgi:hypothetical protein
MEPKMIRMKLLSTAAAVAVAECAAAVLPQQDRVSAVAAE